MTDFVTRLTEIHGARPKSLALLLAPRLARLPLPIQVYDDPFLPYGKAIIKATRDVVSLYLFDLAAYLAVGAAGAVALERTIHYVRGDSMTVLHGPFALRGYAALLDEQAFGADAATVTDSQFIDAYLTREDKGVFVMRSGSPKVADAPRRVGVYWQEMNILSIVNPVGVPLNFEVLGETFLGQFMSEEFTVQIRAALEAYGDV
ncbi:MAG: hypothetical protein SF029_22645 [bacterium]|nr:hypothetical protein [bacterium]